MISIIIPTYEMEGHGSAFLLKNLNSILDQDFNDYEIIISDNSKSNIIRDTIEMVGDKRIKYFKSNKKGISGNTNYGIDKANGDLIKILFQDDYFYTKNCLSKLNEIYNLYVFSRIHEKKGFISQKLIPVWNKDILLRNTISAPSVISFPNNGIKFDENLTWLMDVEFYHRLFLNYKEPLIIKDAVIGIYQWSGQVTNKLSKTNKVEEYKYISKKYDICF